MADWLSSTWIRYTDGEIAQLLFYVGEHAFYKPDHRLFMKLSYSSSFKVAIQQSFDWSFGPQIQWSSTRLLLSSCVIWRGISPVVTWQGSVPDAWVSANILLVRLQTCGRQLQANLALAKRERKKTDRQYRDTLRRCHRLQCLPMRKIIILYWL